MTDEVLMQQVLALRSSAVTLVSQSDAVLAALAERMEAAPKAPAEKPASSDPRECGHPSSARVDTTTMGGSARSWFCKGCRHTSEEVARLAAADIETAGGAQ